MASQYFSRIKTVGFSLRLNSWLQLAIISKFLSPDIKNQRLIIYVKELCCDHIELRRIGYIKNNHYIYYLDPSQFIVIYINQSISKIKDGQVFCCSQISLIKTLSRVFQEKSIPVLTLV